MQVLQLQTNAQALFKALAETQTAPQPALPRASRSPGCSGGRTSRRSTARSSPTKPPRSKSCAAGGNFGEMCEALCEWHEADAVPLLAAGMLKRWIVEQMISV